MLKWPEQLKLTAAGKKALERVSEKSPVLAQWPEDTKIHAADDAEEMAQILIAQFHEELRSASLAYLFKEKMGGRGWIDTGKADLANPVLKYFSGCDFIIKLNWTVWKAMDLVQRTALLDHELEHCGISDSGKYEIQKHDVQEFNAIVGRWGAYHETLAQFLRVANPQLGLELHQGGKGKGDKATAST